MLGRRAVGTFPWPIAVLTMLFIAGCAATSTPQPSATARQYRYTVAAGLSPEWTPEAAAQATLDYIAVNERAVGRAVVEPRIRGIQVVHGADAAHDTGGDNNVGDYGVVIQTTISRQ